jgi:hypothetical protein
MRRLPGRPTCGCRRRSPGGRLGFTRQRAGEGFGGGIAAAVQARANPSPSRWQQSGLSFERRNADGTACSMSLRFTACDNVRRTVVGQYVSLQGMPASDRGTRSQRYRLREGSGQDRRPDQGLRAGWTIRLALGDVVTVTRIDRRARSAFDLFGIVKRIVDAKAQFRSLAEPWADTGTSSGRLMLAVLGGLADVERDLIRTRTAGGRGRAKAQGKRIKGQSGHRPRPCRYQRRSSAPPAPGS